jgi:hypothetical protein
MMNTIPAFIAGVRPMSLSVHPANRIILAPLLSLDSPKFCFAQAAW